jgi:zinc protease
MRSNPHARLVAGFRAFVVTLVVAMLACSRPVTVQPVQFRMRDFHLRSGLRVIVEEDHAAPVVGVVNVVGSGSTSDPRGKEGLAHLVEHLTFRAKQAPGRTAWSLLSQAGAADWNAATGLDATTYYEFGALDVLVDLLTLEGLRIVDPLAGVDEKTFEVEREVVRNELRERGETRVTGAVFAELSKVTFPDAHPYSRAPIGTHESLSSLTLEDARAFVKEHYRPSNMTLLVIGDVKLETFEKVFSASLPPILNQPSAEKVPTGPRLAANAPEPPTPAPSKGLTVLEGSVATPELYIAWSLPRSWGEANYLARMAVGLVASAVNDAGLHDNDIVGGSAFAVPGTLAGMLVGHVILRDGTHPEKSAEAVVDRLYRGWAKGSNENLLAGEVAFNQLRAGLATKALSDAQDPENRGLERAEFVHFTGDPALYNRQFAALESVDRSKFADFNQRYVNRERARFVLVRPTPESQRAPAGRTGIADLTDDDAHGTYQLPSISKVALGAGFAQNFQSDKLDNGLMIEATRRGTLPIVTVGIAFRGSPADEPKQGAAEFAWLTGRVQRAIYGHFYERGAILRARRSDDGVVFEVHAPASELGRVLQILADHVASLRVHRPLDDFDRYRLPYVRREQALPEQIAARSFRRALFVSNPYGHTGEIPDDTRPDESAANAWLETVLSPRRGVLAIAGNVDPAEALTLARDAFSGWSGAAGPTDPPPLAEAGSGATIVTHRPGATQAQVGVGCRLPPSTAAQSVGNEVVARAMDGRLHAIRNQMGVSYGFHVSTSTLVGGTAILYISGTVENGGLTGALRTIHSELVGAPRLVKSDLDRGRWAVARRYNLDLVTPDDWVGRAMAVGRRGWDLKSVDDVPHDLLAFDPAPLVAALRRCATEGVVSVVGDETIARRSVAEGWK